MRLLKKLKSKLIRKVLKPLLVKALFIVAKHYIKKKMGCTTTTLKFTVFVMSVLCAIFGGLMLTASAYGLSDFRDSYLIPVPCTVGIVLGLLLFLTIIPACTGPLREREQGVWVYATCIFILMIAQIIVNVTYSLNFDNLATEIINHAWNQELTHNGTMSVYEAKYNCCGKTGPDDYASYGLLIPPVCYKHENTTIEADLYTIGCTEKLREEFQSSEKLEIISDWTLVGVEGVTAILAAMLAINLKNVKRRKEFH